MSALVLGSAGAGAASVAVLYSSPAGGRSIVDMVTIVARLVRSGRAARRAADLHRYLTGRRPVSSAATCPRLASPSGGG